MNYLDEYKIEKLILMANEKKIVIDDILDTHYTLKDYEDELKSIRMCNEYSYSFDKRFRSVREKNDALSICKLLIEARKNRKELEKQKEKVQESPIINLDMSLDDLDTPVESSTNVYDALILSLANKAKVDIHYISISCGLTKDEVIDSLKGIIFQNPETWNEDKYHGWETADEYLSGSMFNKLNEAFRANSKYNGLFKSNIEAIRKVYPKILTENDIYITLGSPWIPADIIDDFIVHLLGNSLMPNRKLAMTKHDKISGTWETPNNGRYYLRSVACSRTWGTQKCSALRIIENSLNMKKPQIFNYKQDGTKELDKEETALAQEKQKEVIEEFKKWVWTDPERKKRLLKIYEDKYGSFVRRKYDGSFLTFPQMSESVKLFDYQKNAVARILFSKNTLLAHDVGSGKTYEMVAAGMELKRIGLSKKNLFVVPNNIVGQWHKTFLEIYPNANILVVEPKTFTPTKRNKVLEDIRDNDYDAIIMAYSCFDLIPLSRELRIAALEKEKLEIVQAQCKVTTNTSILDKRKEVVNKKILSLRLEKDLPEGICFDDLGITRMFIDEAHNYKNVPIQTKMSMVMGVNATGSKKCGDMLNKVNYIQSMNNGGGIVMATGTPITNSITETYIMQLYLQRGQLNLLDLESFDSWAGMFGETTSDFEIDVATNSYRIATRFSKFHNLPELTNILSSIADFHILDDSNGIPKLDGYTDIKITKTKELNEVLMDISKRADLVRTHKVSKKLDNMLNITTDGRKAALDLRLLNVPTYHFNLNSKVYECANNIYQEYADGQEHKTTQLVFCDSSTPKEGFNMYDELSRLLVSKGIHRDEIAYIHDATSDKQRDELYEKVRKGEIRILIGSTFKLGLGVNVQEKVIALHHLDIPWRPADMRQREGRILRQGNTNKEVRIYRYVTEGSFDAYSWQLLEMKQKFISDLLSGSLDTREEDEIDNTVLSYAEIKALAIGNPLIKERVETLNEISRLKLIETKTNALKLDAQRELLELPIRIEELNNRLVKANEDYDYVLSLKLDEKEELTKEEQEKRKALRQKIDEAVNNNNILIPENRSLLTYNNFELILPSYMSKNKPYLYVKRNGLYTIDLGESETGNLIRIDNFFINFKKVVNDINEQINKTNERKIGLENELLKKDDSFDKIKELKIKLQTINERLGLQNE